MITTLTQLGRDVTASGRNGTTTYTFVALPLASGGYAAFTRPENIGGIVTSRAGHSMRAADRHSSTDVEVEIPDGTLIKTVAKSQRSGSEIGVQVVRGEELINARYVGARRNGAAWDTIVEIDGQRVTIPG